MSTILDALKKIERDRESPHDESAGELDFPPSHPRRGISTRVILACAGVGFAAGIALALWRDTAPLQQAAAPGPVTAPVIDVPPAPVAKAAPRAKAAPPPIASDANQAAPRPPQAAPLAAGGAPAALPAPPIVIGSDEHAGSALEPSPFAADHEAPVQAPAPAGGKHGVRGPRRAPVAGAAPGTAHDTTPPHPLVALAPPLPPPAAMVAPPPLAPAPPPTVEAEPAQPPPVAIDTGRSPPGSPRVSLTFLQWSSDPDRRFAFVSIDGAPAQRVREGDTPNGMTIAEITPTGVQFKRGDGQLFMIRPRH